jgi:mRNA deadenylase 3'-5' endonuclease subunit Ccr4
MEKNLLAQDYVKEYKYPWTRQTPGCLEWDHRKSLIVDKLLDPKAKADIVCLQEAQKDLFAELLTSLSHTYDGVIQNTTRGHNVGRSFSINTIVSRNKNITIPSNSLSLCVLTFMGSYNQRLPCWFGKQVI